MIPDAANREHERAGDENLEAIAGYKVHPLASKFPLIVGKEFDDLVEAAARAGRLYPVETHKGFLIDGRNRLRVQEELLRRGVDIDLPVVEWEPTGDETVEEHIWSVNANRRHQTPDQLAVLALVFLPSIRAARQARQEASRFGKNGTSTAAVKSTPPDGAAATQGRTSAEKDAASSVGGLAAMANCTNYKAALALTLHKAVEEGEVSESEIDAVVAGDKRLCDAVPRRKAGGRKKARADGWDEADDDDLHFEETPSLDEEATAGSSLEADIDRFLQMLMDETPVTEHRDMCRLLKRKVAAIEKQRGW
jgi:hypothetical protein